jgi:hypothetical protein
MDRAIHNRADVSIGTPSGEGGMQSHQIQENLNSLMLKIQRNYEFQTNDQKQTL